MATDLNSYVPPMVEPGCGTNMFNPTPCPADGEMSLETIFDIIQTPIIGLILAVVLYLQFRKQQNTRNPVLWAIGGGVLASAIYGAYKFLL